MAFHSASEQPATLEPSVTPTATTPAAVASRMSLTVSPTFTTAETAETFKRRMFSKIMKGQGRPNPPVSSAVTQVSGA